MHRHPVMGTALGAGLSLALASAPAARSAEVDNYTTAGFQPVETIDAFNGFFNASLATAVRQFVPREGESGHEARSRLALGFHRVVNGGPLRMGGVYDWYIRSGLPFYRSPANIYDDLSFFDRIKFKIKKPALVIFLNGVPIGVDKVSHFFDGGWAVFKREYVRRKPGAGLAWAVWSETSILGMSMSGVFSNGDIVADYEGNLLFQSLVEDGADGAPAIVGWDGTGRPFVRRPIDLRAHVNSFWNEAMFPSEYSRKMGRHVMSRIQDRFGEFRAHPEWYLPREEGELLEKYRAAGLALRPHPEFRLDAVCR